MNSAIDVRLLSVPNARLPGWRCHRSGDRYPRGAATYFARESCQSRESRGLAPTSALVANPARSPWTFDELGLSFF